MQTSSTETEAAQPLSQIAQRIKVGAARLETMPDAELARLTQVIEAAVARNRRRVGTTVQSMIMLSSLVIGINGSLPFALRGYGLERVFFVVCLVGVANCTLNPLAIRLLFTHWARRITAQERSAIEHLLTYTDVRIIGSLIDALQWTQHRDLLAKLQQTLARLLPYLTEQQAQDLGAERHSFLAACLKHCDRQRTQAETDLLPGILYVMACVGKNEFKAQSLDNPRVVLTIALPRLLNRWASGKGAGQDSTVRETALACRQTLEKKQAAARTGAQLLRAADSAPSNATDLLHPAQGTAPTDPQELLRATREP